MAVILYIETSTRICSVGLSRNGKWLALREDRSRDYSHSALLTVFMEEVLKEAGVKADEVDAVAVSRGPGSYTGLRIGVSAAKGFCYALDIPLIAVDTLKALTAVTIARGGAFADRPGAGSVTPAAPPGSDANTGAGSVTPPIPPGSDANSVAGAGTPVSTSGSDTGSGTGTSLSSTAKVLYCPMIDARRMEVYYALLTPDLQVVKPTAAEVITGETFKELLKHHRIVFCGDGAEKCREVIDSPGALFMPDSLPSAEGMLMLAEDQLSRKDFVDVAYFEPFYLKDFVAGKPKVKGLYS